MSDILDDADIANDELIVPESDDVGMTSDESPVDSADSEVEEKKKPAFTVFDAMLLISLICIVLATLMLVLEINKFGPFPGSFPWRIDEV
jgi:hypothetical protein